jgi:hypothetical protein
MTEQQKLPPIFNRLAWSNLAAPIVAVLLLGGG